MKNLKFLILILFAISGCGNKKKSFLKSSEKPESIFLFGSTEAPTLNPPGPGSGAWDSEDPQFENRTIAKVAKHTLGLKYFRKRYGVEAAETFKHYFKNTGADFEIKLGRLFSDVPKTQLLFMELVNQLRVETSGFSSGTYDFTMKKAFNSQVLSEENENWYLAVAGFSYWISGQIVVDEKSESPLKGTLQFHIWDRYDWDPGVSIPISTPLGEIDVDQERIGEFHREGLAKEFDTVGALSVQI